MCYCAKTITRATELLKVIINNDFNKTIGITLI